MCSIFVSINYVTWLQDVTKVHKFGSKRYMSKDGLIDTTNIQVYQYEIFLY